MTYEQFASNISFFEFSQEEFYPPSFDLMKYESEIKTLRNHITIDSLVKILESKPKTFDILEQLFQLNRFTNAQYIHFCFDVNILNNYEEEMILQHAENSIFKFDNSKQNHLFNEIFSGVYEKNDNKTRSKLFIIKKSIPLYVDKCIKDPTRFHIHLTNSISSRVRISQYLINNLKASEFLSAVDLEKFLLLKRIPRDTKGIHGTFGIIKISKKLESLGINDVTKIIADKILKVDNAAYNPVRESELAFVREKYLEQVYIRKTKKLKKFDFIILKNGIPRILIETNFYSTSGTKIGINVGEYTDLHEDILLLNKVLKMPLIFSWISDGNFWLTIEGEKLFNNIKQNYFGEDIEILNYNLLSKYLLKDLLNI